MELVYFTDVSRIKRAADDLFLEQARLIRTLVPGSDVQHVGSSAIPECLTKGDLDIQVRISADAFEAAKAALQDHYQLLPGGFSESGAVSFKDDSTNPPLGVHLTVIGGGSDIQWKFREVLLARRDLRAAYDDLKRQLQGKSMDDYRIAKDKFFQMLRETPEYRAFQV